MQSRPDNLTVFDIPSHALHGNFDGTSSTFSGCLDIGSGYLDIGCEEDFCMTIDLARVHSDSRWDANAVVGGLPRHEVYEHRSLTDAEVRWFPTTAILLVVLPPEGMRVQETNVHAQAEFWLEIDMRKTSNYTRHMPSVAPYFLQPMIGVQVARGEPVFEGVQVTRGS